MKSGFKPPSCSEASGCALPRLPARRPRPWSVAAWALLLATLAAPAIQAGSLAVVVHPTVPADDLSFSEFRKIILGDRQHWAAGQPITVIVRGPEAPERAMLLDQVYRMNEAQFRQYWVAKVFRAEATSAPRVVLSNAEAVDLVTVIDGSITVVSVEDVPEGLKVLRIDGKLPGETGYRFE